jgi:hypothetical protein
MKRDTREHRLGTCAEHDHNRIDALCRGHRD